MTKSFVVLLAGVFSGIFIALLSQISRFSIFDKSDSYIYTKDIKKPKIIGFLPYWLAEEEKKDYSNYLNSVAYFGLTVGEDGKIIKLTNPTETDPGWLSLKSKKITRILDSSADKKMDKSLVVFSGDQNSIERLIDNPELSAKNLMNDVSPILKEYKFNDLNIDIESFTEASEEARLKFTKLIKEIDIALEAQNPEISLSIDVSPTALIKPFLVDVRAIAPYVDVVIFMTYDFHYQGSFVTGSVSPVGGANISAEFDVETSMKEAQKILPREKIILGVPLYGYQWEALSNKPNAAVIPGSGITASNKRVEKFLNDECASCEAKFDPVSKESFVIYKDQETGTYIQIFYPDKRAMQEKINIMNKYKLGGIALWALGYEGENILEPLKNMK